MCLEETNEVDHSYGSGGDDDDFDGHRPHGQNYIRGHPSIAITTTTTMMMMMMLRWSIVVVVVVG
jgi:hypothetical protein